MLVLVAAIILVALGVWLFCLFEVLSTDEADARHLPKFAWFLIILLGFELGAIAWLVFGRPRHGYVTADLPAWPPGFLPSGGGGRPEPEGVPRGPDDDPDFLRDLDRRLRGEED